ncbi:sensor histidine kinase [Oceaniglobus roseus]|uniref:sensor histidine kinase n=1 Tax=Oceaniglobus roseus TaxID=1737570 RepID=UPI001562A4CF|nr:sensor histidine kinase [Kandeliimicrobium roseum]
MATTDQDISIGRPAEPRPSRGLGWAARPLHHRFAIAGSLVTLVGMAVIGTLVGSSIETGVVRNSAISSAVYMESFIAPLSQELVDEESLSPETIARMNALLEQAPLSERVVSVKIWRPGGLLAFSSDPDLIGMTFPPSEELARAWRGELNASYDELEGAESLRERQSGMPLLEVYNPIHSIVTGEIIAVAEFYLNATELEADLRLAHARAWVVVALVTLATFLALFGIVRSGSRTIADQTRRLKSQLDELARISAQNQALRTRVQGASQRVSETNERYMRRLSAELHDGPAQALALASLRLTSLMRRAGVTPGDPEAQNLRDCLEEALRDVRDLCSGLTLPELDGKSVTETLDLATNTHERRTGVTVERAFRHAPVIPGSVPHPFLICIYRFVQEGLMNAFRHAPGAPVRVDAQAETAQIVIAVQDDGPGFDPGKRSASGLGLAGLRERIESIGGVFRIDSREGQGTRLVMTLPIEEAH